MGVPASYVNLPTLATRPALHWGLRWGLHWLRPEIEANLARARALLEQHLDTGADSSALTQIAAQLQTVRGALSMIQRHGAARLAAEMLSLLAQLRAGSAARPDEGYAALTGATLQLSDYLDLLASGEPDRAVLLQPVLNELRAARGQTLVTEAELFAAQAQTDALHADFLPPLLAAAAPGAAQAYAKQELPAFQQAFLQWFRGLQASDPMARLGQIAAEIADRLHAAEPRLAWAGFAALAEALRSGGDSLELKRLFGRAGSLLKTLAEQGEDAASAQTGDTPWLLLWQLAQLPRPGDRARALLEAAGGSAHLPSRARLDALRRRLRAPGSGILERLNAELREDFAKIKDGIDLAVRTGGQLRGEASGAVERLRRLATTLAALGQAAPQQALLNQVRILEAGPPDALTWMEIATAILRVEHSLGEALFRSLGRHGDDAPRAYAQIESQVPHAQDLRDGLRALLRESLLDCAQVRAAVEVALDGGEGGSLVPAAELLHEINAGLQLLGHDSAAASVARLEQALASSLLTRASAERFADALACTEVFLEALRDELPQPARLADDLAAYVERFVAAPSQARAQPTPAITEAATTRADTGVDPELRAIFADEADEVLATLRRGLPALQRDPTSIEALTPLRRGFHTLKGSGRTVGATRIAAFGWSLERLLNRCLDGTQAGDATSAELVGDAIDLLPGLIDNLRRGGAEDARVAALLGRVDGLCEVARPQPEADLKSVFRDDARQRLAAAQRWLEQQGVSEAEASLDNELVLDFHTLKGSAAVVNAVALSRLSGAAEHTLIELRQHGRGLSPAGLVLFADVVRTGLSWVDALTEDRVIPEDAAAGLQSALAGLLAPAASTGEAETAKPLAAAVDEEFAIAALDIAQGLEAEARGWSLRPAEPVAATLHGGFLELAGRAAAAPSTPLAAFAEALANHLAAWAFGVGDAPGPGFHHALAAIFEGWYQLLDRYRDGSLHAVDTDPWLARIARLPAPGEADLEIPPPVVEPVLAPTVESMADAPLRVDSFAFDGAAHEPLPEPDTLPAMAPEQALEAAFAIIETELAAPVAAQFESTPELAIEPPLAAVPEPQFETAAAMPPAPAEASAPQGFIEPESSPDPELLDIFSGEADELVEALHGQVADWRREPQAGAPAELRRALHTLKGSARTAGINAIGSVAHRLESLLDAPSEPEQLLARFGAGLDGLQRQADALHSGALLPAAPIIAAIDALPATPAAPQPLDEPPAIEWQHAAERGHFDPALSLDTEAVPELGMAAEVPELSLASFDQPPEPNEAGLGSAEVQPPAALLDAPLSFQLAPELLVEQAPTAPVFEPEFAAPGTSFELPPDTGYAQVVEPLELATPAWPPIEPAPFDANQFAAPAGPFAGFEPEQPPGTAIDLAANPEWTLPFEATPATPPLAAETFAEAPPSFAPQAFEANDRLAGSVVTEPSHAAPSFEVAPVEPFVATGYEQAIEAPQFVEQAAFEAQQAPEPLAIAEDFAPVASPAPFVAEEATPSPPEPAADIDPELREIYAAEAAELLTNLDHGFEAWRGGNAGAPVLELLRALHTLKGSARVAGQPEIAASAHALESRINSVLANGDAPDAAGFATLQDDIAALRAQHEPLGVAEIATAALARPAPVANPVTIAEPRGWAPELFRQPEAAPEAAAAARREMARVPVEALDRMLGEAGEVAVVRSRLEEAAAGVRGQLGEMTQTLARVREQLRLMDIETDAQIAARGLASNTGNGYARDFDPLELDRYSRMQELSRALAESMSDLGALQSTMTEAIGNSEALLQQQGRAAAEVQQGLMGTLMVPFSRQVQRLQRLVKQTAQENGRLAELLIVGAEAELDRNVLERMTAPLEHLLRNALVHGIETPDARRAAGKPESGTIRIELKRDGAQLLLEVADDGAGLNLPAIRAKAVALGLMPEDARLADDALARFIFEPGFSTAQKLTQDAGRGIGMDVVAATVKQLGGSIALHSEPGVGARFRIRLPLTLAVSQVLMVTVGGETYALPLPAIEGIARIPRASLAAYLQDDGPSLDYGGQTWRVRRLAEFIDLAASQEDSGRSATVVLIHLGDGLGSSDGQRLALVVDRLIGNREIVSKGAGEQLSSVPGVTGATLLADGRVVLILDVPALLLRAERRAAIASATPVAAVRDERQTVMVVDDSVTMRRVAERLLSRAGYRVVLAKDGLDAIAQLQTESPQVVLLDIEMPRADGFEVASFIRNSARLGKLPIVMITSRSSDKHRARAEAIGVDRYMTKPYNEDELLAEITTLIGAER